MWRVKVRSLWVQIFFKWWRNEKDYAHFDHLHKLHLNFDHFDEYQSDNLHELEFLMGWYKSQFDPMIKTVWS